MKKTQTIDELCELVTDGTHYTPKDVEDGFPFLTVRDITDEGLNFNTCSLISEKDFVAAKNANCSPELGDVLFSKDGTVGKVFVVDSDKAFAVLSSIAILRPKQSLILPNYLGFALRSPAILGEALRRKTGSAIRRIILSDLKKVQIQVPTISNQKEVILKLNKASSVIQKRNTTITLIDNYLRSLFIEMFGDPVTNPMGWEIRKIGKIIDGIESGKNVNPVENNDPQGLRVLKVSSVTWGIFDWTESKPLPPSYQPTNHTHFVKTGDFLFSRANTTELVGAVTIVHQVPPNILLPDKLWRIKWNKNIINPQYALFVLRNPKIRDKLSKFSSGSSGSMKNISQGKFVTLEIPIPPYDIQLKFAKAVDEADTLRKKLIASQSDMELMFQSLLAETFSENMR